MLQERVPRTPRPPRIPESDCYYTCNVCAKIRNYCKLLDDKPICGGCLDELLHGADRRLCQERGYHVSSSWSYSSPYYLTAYCLCGHRRQFHGETDQGEKGMFVRQFPISEPPKQWTNEGVEVPLQVADGQ